ncbi:MAG: dihydrodipicolinate synthase family protein [Tannerella sp.]|jgi:4-hydroxy-tetrahydrodipicolinate synthase|nr:dihydrodipicolinate synthase family protein [Tannerella sp.]
MKNKYKGVVIPMVTPVKKDGSVNSEAVKRIIASFVANEASPLLMGTTGEGNSVAPDQALILVKAAVEEAAGKITIYAGLSGCSIRQHIQAASDFRKLGVDVIVATLPSYYMLTDEQMFLYYKTLADNISAPLMLYNIKATTHMSIPLDVVEKLSKHPNIVGLKDSERDVERMKECIGIASNEASFSYFSGWAAQSANSLTLGADGIVPSTGNFVPEMFRELYSAAINGNIAHANHLQNETDRIAKIYQEGRTLGQSLAALKIMMKTKNLCDTYMLPPLTGLSPEETEEIIAKTKNINN